MATNPNEGLKIWEALKAKVIETIRGETNLCIRAKKMTVQSVNTTKHTVTVYEPYGADAPITIPYRKGSSVETAKAGQSVIVEYYYGSMSNAVAVSMGNGY